MSGTEKGVEAARISRMVYEEMERTLHGLLGPENVKAVQVTFDGAWQTLGELAQTGIKGVQIAIDLISELIRDLTGVVSFNIIPKPPAEIEVDIKLKTTSELPFKETVAPFVEMEAVCIAKRIHFQALVDKEINGLRCNINEGFSIRFSTPLGKPTVPIQGTVILKHDEKKQLVMETTTNLPGTTFPVSITIPIKQLLRQARKKAF
ncbi:MAG: hypothetical protein JSS83_13260 [Cyanobacteria bacterium SZAS LIN-3]|nr:hypothetical protein [Cyanobacteria bacterium SZAS LIN-3]MBS2005507.1 hypothetical protein [Cyanobacteria bacterium SZAS TMP-1]